MTRSRKISSDHVTKLKNTNYALHFRQSPTRHNSSRKSQNGSLYGSCSRMGCLFR